MLILPVLHFITLRPRDTPTNAQYQMSFVNRLQVKKILCATILYKTLMTT